MYSDKKKKRQCLYSDKIVHFNNLEFPYNYIPTVY